MNAAVFRSVFEQTPPHLRKRYKLRWDWHLRNLLYALIPPATLYLILRFVEWRFDVEGKKLIRVAGDEDEKAEEEGGGKSVEERVEELERALKEIRGEGKGVVERAKIVAKGVSRQLRNGGEEERKNGGQAEVKSNNSGVVKNK